MVHYRFVASWADDDGRVIDFTFYVDAVGDNHACMKAMLWVEWFAGNCKSALEGFDYKGVSITDINTRDVL